MNRHLMCTMLAMGLVLSAQASEDDPEPYRSINIREVFSKMITRDETDRVYSGQIKTQAGLEAFEKAYVVLGNQQIDFTKQMLIFGITDEMSTRAIQFLAQERMRDFTLDYADTGIRYRMEPPQTGKKYSQLQVFILDRIDGIPHIKVKNLVRDRLSTVYDEQDLKEHPVPVEVEMGERVISWEVAVQRIREGDVVQVGQSHAHVVDLLMKDKQRFETKAPDGEALFRVLKEVDPEKQRIGVILE